MQIKFKVYEDDWSLGQHKDPMSFGLESWLNSLAEDYNHVEVVAFQHSQNSDTISGTTTLNEYEGEKYNNFKVDPYETVYCIVKVWN